MKVRPVVVRLCAAGTGHRGRCLPSGVLAVTGIKTEVQAASLLKVALGLETAAQQHLISPAIARAATVRYRRFHLN